jgi:hypothetical protein
VHLISAHASAIDGKRVTVALTVRNDEDASSYGRLWWSLTRAPERIGTDASNYVSEQRTIQLRARSQTTIQWLDTVNIDTGTYRLEAWLQIRHDQAPFGSARGKFVAAISMVLDDANGCIFERRTAATGGFSFKACNMATAPQEYPAVVRISLKLDNVTAHPTTMAIRWEVAAQMSHYPNDWWHLPTLFRGPQVAVELGPRETMDVTFNEPLNLTPGSYAVRMALTDGIETYDEVLLRGAVAKVDPPDMGRKALPVGSLMIERIEAGAIWREGRTASVRLLLLNHTGKPQEAETSWIVGRQGDLAPWLSPIAAGRPQRLVIDAWAEQWVTVSSDAIVTQPGRYSVTGWVHGRGSSGELVHNDAAEAAQPVTVTGWDSSISRQALPVGPLMIERLEVGTTWRAGQPVSLQVLLLNHSSKTQEAETSWVLARPGDVAPWLDPLGAGNTERVVIGPWAEQWVTVSSDGIVVQPAKYDLTAWVHVRGRSGAFVHNDAAHLAQPITVSGWDPTIDRRALPVGALMIERMEAVTTWRVSQPVSLRLLLFNHTGKPQEAEAGWILGHQGDAFPWVDPVAAGNPQRLVIDPWAEQWITISTDAMVARPGRYDLTGWVHARDVTGAFVHNDVVRFVAPIDAAP